MATEHWEEDMKVTAKDLRNGLAAAVQGIQWNYAIFWSASASQPGLLEWGDAYYNGDIKTRKMTQSLELEDDRMGLKRSEQLRQLYISLSAGDSDQQARRPSALLSPEDLSDSEWFYLLCMSFTFHSGHGLVGRTLATGSHIWLTDAHSAESKIFTRSLLAKTVFCFPFLNGVLELGTAESVRSDLIRQVTTHFWDCQKAASAEETPSGDPISGEGVDRVVHDCDLDMLDPLPAGEMLQLAGPRSQSENGFQPLSSIKVFELNGDGDDGLQADSSEELETFSPDHCVDIHTDESAMMDGPEGMSQTHSWQFLDDEPANDCKCPSSSDLQPVPCPKQETRDYVNDPKACRKLDFSFDAGADSLHYKRTLSAIFGSSARPRAKLFFPNGSCSSSFVAWRKGTNIVLGTRTGAHKQKLLKKILFNRLEMRGGRSSPPQKDGRKGAMEKPEGDEFCSSPLSSERRQEKMNKNFLILKSLLPSINKYLKELEKRVEFLESHMDPKDLEVKELSKHPDITERTSDNYGRDGVDSDGKKSSVCKRKASDSDEQGFESHWVLSKNGDADVNVTVVGKEVMIQVTCPWRDCLLLEVVDAVSGLHLDAHSVQSSTVDGNLRMTIKSKFRGIMVASPGMIKGMIHRVVSKC
ncbi:unnamed protein product [Spirodela intermedia]|uniref:Uncharacterized protein n=1 Tax=Spirodela intermedia TaxID=51605 RepID=A0A7I8ID95_SPIIN|nr:unnamed protein product [Spirodela intermedia]CAA6655591.1 unnamed protein product [Spirodela intermedia]